ncbi:MAG: hypothetical protein ACI87E_004168 [Mariniblastus sp.]|jgi:hypothetical protein
MFRLKTDVRLPIDVKLLILPLETNQRNAYALEAARSSKVTFRYC